jgi:ribosome biogenesis protein ENP2
MQVANFNGCKVYNLTSTKTTPIFLTEAKKRTLSKDVEYRRRLELIQDFEMTTASQCLKMTPDGEHIILTGGYPPLVRCYTVSDMAMKFQRGMSADVVAFECLSDDYSKLAFLQADRTLAFHAAYGKHYNIRVPKFGRDLAYGWDNCDMYVGTSGSEVYRINLESGQFKEPFMLGFSGCNKVRINQAYRLVACGGEGGVVELWDHRARRSVASHHVDTDGNVDVTALTWDTDRLTLGVGTSSGNCILYDIRSKIPIHSKEHQYGLPIVDVTFHNDSRHVISTDSKIVKIWARDEPNTGKIMTNIETPANINAVHVVADQRGQSGLIMLAGEQSRVMSYFVPQLGPAPRWCSFLEGLTEELDETANNTVYEDYKFVTKAEIEELGATALIGTKMLKGYMHGYFMEMKLYSKLRAVSKPFEYEEHRKKRIQEKIEEKRGSRIIAKKRLPKVNKELAEKMLRQQKSGAKGSQAADDASEQGGALVDDRFAALFKREEFQQDQESYEFRLRNPTLATGKPLRHGATDESDEEDMYTAVREDGGRGRGNDTDEDGDDDADDYDDDDDDDQDADDIDEWDADDLEVHNPDAPDNRRGSKTEHTKRLSTKAAAKELQRRKRSAQESYGEEEGAILRASRKAADRAKVSNKDKRMFEISDAYEGGDIGPLGANSREAKEARSAQRERGTVPLAQRLESTVRSGTSTRTIKSGTRFVKQMTYVPKEPTKGAKKAKR